MKTLSASDFGVRCLLRSFKYLAYYVFAIFPQQTETDRHYKDLKSKILNVILFLGESLTFWRHVNIQISSANILTDESSQSRIKSDDFSVERILHYENMPIQIN